VNKTDLIEIAAADSGVAPSDAAKVIDSLLTTVTSTLTRGEDVTIPGFGKFSSSRPFSAPPAPAETPPAAPSLRSKPRLHQSSPRQPASRRQSTPTAREQPIAGAGVSRPITFAAAVRDEGLA
jgi:Bacterial DNA-binding protein